MSHKVNPDWSLAEAMEVLAALHTIIGVVEYNHVLVTAEERLRAEVNRYRELHPRERERLDAQIPFREAMRNDT